MSKNNLSLENIQSLDRMGSGRGKVVIQSRLSNTDMSLSNSGIAPSVMGPLRRLSRATGGGDSSTSTVTAVARKMSIFRRLSLGASSISTNKTDPPPAAPIGIQYQNTYRMGPEQHEKFCAGKVQKVMQQILESYLEGEVYDAKSGAHLSQNLTEVIKTRVKEMGYPRYKLVCSVVIGQNRKQGFQYASRSIWDLENDTSATASYNNGSLFAVATVFGTYYE